MKRSIELAIFGFILSLSCVPVFAQHCPFDGGMAVVIQLTNDIGNPVTDADNMKLVEVSKMRGKKVADKDFLPTREALVNVYGERYLSPWNEEACDKDCHIFRAGMYLAHLRFDETYYEVKKGKEVIDIKKDFKIQFEMGKKRQRTINVSTESIFSLCYHHTNWTNIVPIEIVK